MILASLAFCCLHKIQWQVNRMLAIRQWSQQPSAVTGITVQGANTSQWLMRYKNSDRLDWIRHTHDSFKSKQSRTEKVLCFVALPERANSTGFPVLGSFHAKGSSRHPRTHPEKFCVPSKSFWSEYFQSAACLISVTVAVQTDKGTTSTVLKYCFFAPNHLLTGSIHFMWHEVAFTMATGQSLCGCHDSSYSHVQASSTIVFTLNDPLDHYVKLCQK